MLQQTTILLVLLNPCTIYGKMSDEVIRELLTPSIKMGEACGYASCTQPKEGYLNVHIVPHTHGELGQSQTFYGYYTGFDDVYDTTQKNMRRILDYTISELWAKNNRKFTFSDMPYLFYWWARRDETVRRMVYELIRQGRLVLVGGGWSMSDESTTSYHAIIDHFTYSLRKINVTFMECGRPLVAWQTDVVGHSREMAALMAQMGYDGLFVAPVGYEEEFSRLKRGEMDFLWRGSDDLGADTDIYTHILFDGVDPPPGFCFGSLCEDPLIITSSSTFSNTAERIQQFLDSMVHRQAPYYSTQHVMVAMGGRLAYFDASLWFENIDKLIQQSNMFSFSKNRKVYVFYSTPACYLKAVYDDHDTLRTKQDDFYPQSIDQWSYATGAFTSRPSLKYLAREGHRYLQITKQLHVTGRLGDYGQFFEDFHWINGVFQDHQVLTGELWTHVRSAYVKQMDIMLQQSTNIIRDAFNKLRGSPIDTKYFRCQFNISKCKNTCGPQVFIVVYNPLAWPVTIPVRLPIGDNEYAVYAPNRAEKVLASTMPIPELVKSLPGRNSILQNELVFYARDIPPLGFRSYYYQLRTLGWEREKRSLIKKINQKKPKKYLVRQTNTGPIDDDVLLEPEYEYFDDGSTTTAQYETKILFGNVSFGQNQSNFDDVLTPRARTEANTESTSSNSITTSSTVVEDTNVDSPTTANYKSMDEYAKFFKEFEEENPFTKVETTTDTIILSTEIADNLTTTETPPTTEPTPHSTTTTKATPQLRASQDEPPDAEDILEMEHWFHYEHEISEELFIRSQYIRVNLDPQRRISNISVASGIRLSFDVQLVYYVSDDPVRLGKNMSEPGAYVFRSMDNKQEPMLTGPTVVYKSKLAQELHRSGGVAGLVLRLHRDSAVLEVDWIVGPIPVDDGLGKDVFIKYITDLDNQGVFYTDSNGRQTLKRIRNKRPTLEPIAEDPVAGNIYPVTSKIYIEDLKKNIRFSVLNDRSQGGSSLKDGEIDLMLHRRLLTSDPVKEDMNELEFGQGVVARGTHYLYFSRIDNKPTKIFEKKLAKEIELRPQILVSSGKGYGRNTKNIWSSHRNEFSALKTKLPLGVHILTLQQWDPTTLLLRLENYLEKNDVVLSGVKSVYLKDLFVNLKFTDIRETTLGANMLYKNWTPLAWKKDRFFRSFNEAYGNVSAEYSDDKIDPFEEVNLDSKIVLAPQQIRTFLLTYIYMVENSTEANNTVDTTSYLNVIPK